MSRTVNKTSFSHKSLEINVICSESDTEKDVTLKSIPRGLKSICQSVDVKCGEMDKLKPHTFRKQDIHK